MKSDELLLIFCAVLFGIPFAFWFYQDGIYAFLQTADLILLRLYSAIPVVGNYYSGVLEAYEELRPEQLTWQHIWIAGQMAWRPVFIVAVVPMLLVWAKRAWKKRRAQAFNAIDKAYILKHCGTKQTAPDNGARQQWPVRRWYQHFGLHRLPWGGVEWNLRLRKALSLQLGKPVDDPASQELIEEFATFIHGQVVKLFGAKRAKDLPLKVMIEEATRGHAYCATAMVRVLAAAQDTFGVVSPQGFRNRLFQEAWTVPIWFGLNGLMRQTTHVESLGVLSHFYVEVAEGEPLVEPQLENAILGLEAYRTHLIDQRKLKDLDESEYYAEMARREAMQSIPEEALKAKGAAGYKEEEVVLS